MARKSTKKPGRRRLLRDDFDGAWKNMLTPERFEAFIAFFLPQAHEEIDWSRKPEFLEQEMRAITRKTKRGQRSVDKLVKVRLKNGEEQWVLIHIEIQSQVDVEFPARMAHYHFRGRELFPEHPFTCLAILGDNNAQWKPDRYTASRWQSGVTVWFPVVKLKEYEDRLEELEQSDNPFARFVLAHLKTLSTQGDYETRLEWKVRIIQGLYDMGVPEAEIGQLYHDFDWLLALPEGLETRYHRTMTQFEEEREMPHLSTAERIGRREGRKEGREEEARASILEILELRMGSVSPDLAARLNRISDLNRLHSLRKLLLVGTATEEFERVLTTSENE